MSSAWQIAVPFPTLGDNDVHIWKCDLLAKQASLLSPDEQERADRFKVEQPGRQFCNARSTLRRLLGSYLGCSPQDLAFDYGEHGKPAIGKPASDIQFNVSHSHDLALLAFSNKLPLGIDIEWFDRKTEVEPLAKRFYSESEQAEMNALPSEERHAAFLRCWTRKEAYLKAHGSGLSRDTRTFSVCSTGGLIADERDSNAPSQWSIEGLDPDGDYCAALAVRSTLANVSLFLVSQDSLT